MKYKFTNNSRKIGHHSNIIKYFLPNQLLNNILKIYLDTILLIQYRLKSI